MDELEPIHLYKEIIKLKEEVKQLRAVTVLILAKNK